MSDAVWTGKPLSLEIDPNSLALHTSPQCLSINPSSAYLDSLKSNDQSTHRLCLLFADSPKRKDILKYGDTVVIFNLSNNNSLSADPNSYQLYPANIYNSEHIMAWMIASVGNLRAIGESVHFQDKVYFVSSTEHTMSLAASNNGIISVLDIPQDYQDRSISNKWYIRPALMIPQVVILNNQPNNQQSVQNNHHSQTNQPHSSSSTQIYPSPDRYQRDGHDDKYNNQHHTHTHTHSQNSSQIDQTLPDHRSMHPPRQLQSNSSNSSGNEGFVDENAHRYNNPQNNPQNNPNTHQNTIKNPNMMNNRSGGHQNNSLQNNNHNNYSQNNSPFIQQSNPAQKSTISPGFDKSNTSQQASQGSGNYNQYNPPLLNSPHISRNPNPNYPSTHTHSDPKHANNINHQYHIKSDMPGSYHNFKKNIPQNQPNQPSHQHNTHFSQNSLHNKQHHNTHNQTIPNFTPQTPFSPILPVSTHNNTLLGPTNRVSGHHGDDFTNQPVYNTKHSHPNPPQHHSNYPPDQQNRYQNDAQWNNNNNNNSNNNNMNNTQTNGGNMTQTQPSSHITTLTTHQIQQMTPFIEHKLCEAILHAFYGINTELINSNVEVIHPTEIPSFFNQNTPSFTRMSTEPLHWTFFVLDETMTIQVGSQSGGIAANNNIFNNSTNFDLPMSMTSVNNNSFHNSINNSINNSSQNSPQTAIIKIPMGFRNLISGILPICSAYVFISQEIKLRSQVSRYGYCNKALCSILTDLLKNIESMITNLETVLKAGYMGHLSGIQATEALDRQLISQSQFGFLNLNFPFYNNNNNNLANLNQNPTTNQYSPPGQQPLQLTVMKLGKYIRTQIEPLLTSIVILLITVPTESSYDALLQELYNTSRNSYTKHHQLIHQNGVGLTSQPDSNTPIVTLEQTDDVAIGYYIIYPRHEMYPVQSQGQRGQYEGLFSPRKTNEFNNIINNTSTMNTTNVNTTIGGGGGNNNKLQFINPYTNTNRFISGGVLLNHIYTHYFCSNDELSKQVLLSILQYTSIPYFTLLLHWLQHGDITKYDVYNEMFFYTNPSITTTYLLSSPQYFISQYLYVDHTQVPVWLVPYIDLIIQCGKYHMLFKEFWHLQTLHVKAKQIQFSSNIIQQQQQTQLLYLFSLLSHNGTGGSGIISGDSVKHIYSTLLGNSNLNTQSNSTMNRNQKGPRISYDFDINQGSNTVLGQNNIKQNPLLMLFAHQLQQQDQLYNGFGNIGQFGNPLSLSPSLVDGVDPFLPVGGQNVNLIDNNGNTTFLTQGNGTNRRVNLLNKSASNGMNLLLGNTNKTAQNIANGHTTNSTTGLNTLASLSAINNQGNGPLDELLGTPSRDQLALLNPIDPKTNKPMALQYTPDLSYFVVVLHHNYINISAKMNIAVYHPKHLHLYGFFHALLHLGLFQLPTFTTEFLISTSTELSKGVSTINKSLLHDNICNCVKKYYSSVRLLNSYNPYLMYITYRLNPDVIAADSGHGLVANPSSPDYNLGQNNNSDNFGAQNEHNKDVSFTGFDALTLCVSLPYPLTLFIDESVLQMYNQILQHVVYIKHGGLMVQNTFTLLYDVFQKIPYQYLDYTNNKNGDNNENENGSGKVQGENIPKLDKLTFTKILVGEVLESTLGDGGDGGDGGDDDDEKNNLDDNFDKFENFDDENNHNEKSNTTILLTHLPSHMPQKTIRMLRCLNELLSVLQQYIDEVVIGSSLNDFLDFIKRQENIATSMTTLSISEKLKLNNQKSNPPSPQSSNTYSTNSKLSGFLQNKLYSGEFLHLEDIMQEHNHMINNIRLELWLGDSRATTVIVKFVTYCILFCSSIQQHLYPVLGLPTQNEKNNNQNNFNNLKKKNNVNQNDEPVNFDKYQKNRSDMNPTTILSILSNPNYNKILNNVYSCVMVCIDDLISILDELYDVKIDNLAGQKNNRNNYQNQNSNGVDIDWNNITAANSTVSALLISLKEIAGSVVNAE